VTLSTDDPTPTTGHYAITSTASVPGALVAIGPGGAMSGFEVRNAASNGDGVKTACPTSADALPVSLSTVRIAGAAAGPPAARLATGVHVSGYCGASLADVTVDGAATGILVASAGPTIESTATSPHVTRSIAVGVSIIEGKLSFTDGVIDLNDAEGVFVGAGNGNPTFSATRTVFRENKGDAVKVASGTLISDSCQYSLNGTHVHVEQNAGKTLSVVVKNSRNQATMSGAANSAFRFTGTAAATSSQVVILDNDITGNNAVDTYRLGTSDRKSGGLLFTPPLPSSLVFEGNRVASNAGDQVLVASSSSAERLDLRGGNQCETSSNNSFGCYAPGAVGIYSNGATVQIDYNHWTMQVAGPGIDYSGTVISGAGNVCLPSAIACP
jgi:hypothetical protein